MSDKPNKPQKLKARLPRGLADRGPAEIAATRHMVEAIRVVFERYGFEPVETPAIEYTDALGKFLPDQDRPNEGVFSFQDDDEQWLSLRYDLTAPLARYVAENFQNLALPYRSYRFGYVYRNEKPGPGRFRQFMQFDADTVGAPTMAADAEMCMLAADTMEALGIPRGSYVVKVNNRKVLDGVMDAAGIPPEKHLTTMRAIDKLDRLGIDGVRMLLGKGRKDESGDFTKGAELAEDQQSQIISAIISGVSGDIGHGTTGVMTITSSEDGNIPSGERLRIEGMTELSSIQQIVRAAGYERDRIRIDPSVVRGLEYYTGPVYEVELLIETKDDKGRPGALRLGRRRRALRRAGLALHGPAGAGDRLLHRRVAAAGCAHDARQARRKDRVRPRRRHHVRPRPRRRLPEDGRGVTRGEHPRRALSRQPEEQSWRADEIRRQARRALRHHPGRRREGEGRVQIKDLILGAGLTAIKDRDEYLKKQAEAQFAVKEADLVDAVRKLLARHKLG